MIDTKLITFLSVCETKNYTKTAEQLYCTQPSVTNHLKLLEKIYSIKLFKNNKTFELTPQGELLKKYAEQSKAFDEQFERALDASRDGNRSLSFGVTPNIQNSFLKYILPKWGLRTNSLKYNIHEMNFDDILEGMRDGNIDFAIVDTNFPKKNFQTISLAKTNVVAACSKTNYLSQSKRISFEDLLNERIVIDDINSGKYQFLEHELKVKNRSITEVDDKMIVDNPVAMKELCASGVGVGFFYTAEIADELISGKLIGMDLIEVKNQIEFNLIYNKGHISTELIEKIANDFKRIYKEVTFSKYSSTLK